MFAKRNSITLASIWVILLLVGIFWYTKDTRTLVHLMEQKIALSKKLATSQETIEKLKGVEDNYNQLSEQWENLPKKLISADEPSFSLSYINWIMQKNHLEIYFDFVLNQKKQLDNYTRFVYTISGEGDYRDIYKFIWYLTHEPILYKINSIDLRRSEKESDLLKFTMKLQGFTVESQSELFTDVGNLQEVSSSSIRVQRDVFSPLIRPKPVVNRVAKPPKPKLPPKLPGQIDVEKATLKAVTSNSIFIQEGRSGLKELKVGDSVYLGRLVRINHSSNEAEFVITKFGRSQRVVLGIDYRK
ncbi:MAG: type 4a pilus biogenesis protein PilO [bacterium]